MNAKKCSPVAKSVSVGVTSTQIADANPKRVGIVISSPAANRITVNLGATAVDLAGIVLYNTDSPILLSDAFFPGGMRQRIEAIATVAPATIGIVEFIEEP